MRNKLKKWLKSKKKLYSFYINLKNKRLAKKKNKNLHKYGYVVLNELCRELDKTDINYYCSFGTLLGLVRDNKFISNDLDIDLGFVEDNNFSWSKIETAVKNIGMKFEHQFILDDSKVTEKTYSKNGVSVDFFVYELNDKKIFSHTYVSRDDDDYICDVQLVELPIPNSVIYKEIKGYKFPIIDNYDEYLTCCYGKSWKIPDPTFEDSIPYWKNHFGRLTMVENYDKD